MIDRPKLDLHKDIDDYKKFAFGKSMFGMAVAFIMANTIQKVVTAISNGLLMPIINYFVNGTGSNWRHMEFTIVPGMSLETGMFFGAMVDFLIISVLMYIIYIKFIQGVLGDVDTPPVVPTPPTTTNPPTTTKIAD